MTMFDRLSAFLEARKGDIYPEESSDLHEQITTQIVDLLVSKGDLRPDQRVLDVGCGQGPALAEFKKKVFPPAVLRSATTSRYAARRVSM